MKRLVYSSIRSILSSIEVSKHGRPRTNNAFDVKIDSVSEFDSVDDLKDYIKEAAVPYSVNNSIYMQHFIADISERALREGVEKWGDEFLADFLGILKNKDDFYYFIRDNAYNSLHFQSERFGDESKSEVISALRKLNLHGLEFGSRAWGVSVTYDSFNPNIYDLDSVEHKDNWNKIVDFIESMSCVIRCDETYRYEGTQVYADVYVDCNPEEPFTHGPIPRFEQIPKRSNNDYMYTLRVVTQPDYISDQKSRFRQTATGELYVVHNWKVTCPDGSVQSFIDKVYGDDFSESFADWDDYLDWLSATKYEGNGSLLETQIAEIKVATNGKTRTLFKRGLPE